MPKKIKTLPIAFPVRYSSLGTYIYDSKDRMVADVRGWGWIQELPEPEKTQDAIGEYIAQAMNEKHNKGDSDE